MATKQNVALAMLGVETAKELLGKNTGKLKQGMDELLSREYQKDSVLIKEQHIQPKR
jgi:hypothetical protein